MCVIRFRGKSALRGGCGGDEGADVFACTCLMVGVMVDAGNRVGRFASSENPAPVSEVCGGRQVAPEISLAIDTIDTTDRR